MRLVDAGDLEVGFEIACPEDGRTIAIYRAGEALPIGEVLDCEACGEGHRITEDDIWVTFTPTYRLSARLGRADSIPKATPSRPRRGLVTRVIDFLTSPD